MIYRFKLVSDEVSNFSREIEIDSESSFLKLRDAILDSVGYPKQDLDSFFTCDERWNPDKEIAYVDMGTSSDQDIWLMENTRLSELLEDEGQRLVFMFDYLTERCFFMELKEVVPGKYLDEPVCVSKKGNAPSPTVDIDEFTENIERESRKVAAADADDLDSDFYGDSQYDDDELGDGFDEANFN